MTNPVVVKQTLRMGLLSIAQSVGLPLVASVLLAIEMLLFGIPFDLPFVLLLTFVVVLGVPLMQPERGMMTQLIGGRRRLVTRIALRWRRGSASLQCSADRGGGAGDPRQAL